MNIQNLVAELQRQKENSRDLIVNTSVVEAVPVETGVTLRVPDAGEFPLTSYAHGQLAEKLKIPKRYYDRMLSSGKTELLAENINAWMSESDRRMFRILDGNIRAILSDRYRIMDNYDLAFKALEVFREKSTIDIVKLDLTETHMYIKAVDHTLTATIGDADVLNGGIVIRNSEVGAGAFAVEPYVLRQICTNGLIGQHSFQKVHLGRVTTEIGFIDWSEETKALDDRALWSAVHDVISATFDEEVFHGWVDKIERAADTVIEVKPVEVVERVVDHLGMTETQKDDLLMHFMSDGDNTQWGVVNAVTRTAKDMNDAEDQVHYEREAGKLLEMKEAEFMKVVA